MTDSAQFVYLAGAVRALERRAESEFGLDGAVLMQRAGEAAFAVLQECWPGARRIAVVCGPGNNGGDGKVVAELARAAGLEVTVMEPGRDSRRVGGAPTVSEAPTVPEVDVVVDALFGIGLSRAPEGDMAAMIEAINAHPAPVLALDIPSGLDADTGTAPGAAVAADVTVTFLAYKRGLFTGSGPRLCGVPVLDTLDLPDAAFTGLDPVAAVLPAGLATTLLGHRARDAHKGDCGHVLVVGGNRGMAGAAHLAGAAALRTGAGLVSVAVAPGMGDRAQGNRPELMVHEITDPGSLDALLERACVVAIGPGLGTDAWARQMAERVFSSGLPLVVDADALPVIAGRRDDLIITPHPGEAARLLGVTADDVQADRFAALAELVAAVGATVVLKGAASLVGSAGRLPQICIAGNPGMASGGMGDVLTGVIAALRAQGLGVPEAAAAGVQLHAEAGDLAAEESGVHGLLAGDLVDALGGCLA